MAQTLKNKWMKVVRQPSSLNSPSRTSMVWVVSVRSWAVCCRARLSAEASRHWEPCCRLVQSRFLFCGHQIKILRTTVPLHMIFIYCDVSGTLVYCDLHYKDPDPVPVRSLCSFCWTTDFYKKSANLSHAQISTFGFQKIVPYEFWHKINPKNTNPG